MIVSITTLKTKSRNLRDVVQKASQMFRIYFIACGTFEINADQVAPEASQGRLQLMIAPLFVEEDAGAGNARRGVHPCPRHPDILSNLFKPKAGKYICYYFSRYVG
mmetsp:Transcript_26791/g.39681  ORF Transcript_26791/g.39681 Transcript_26791/m.39681 type:complete len:106 (-) Transcript_26791:267-584(-)